MLKIITAPTRIHAAGSPPKAIEEFIGLVTSSTTTLSIARLVRLVGFSGLGISVSVWTSAECSGRGKLLFCLSAGAALLSALLYFIGVMAAGDSGAGRFLPRFP
jgi:hypothetical protein